MRTGRVLTRIGAGLRDHWLVVAFLLAGLVVRVVVMVAYRPALLFPDSYLYLDMSQKGSLGEVAPAGYSFVLWPFGQLTTSVTPIAAVQHLMGLGLAIACYVFLLRRGLPRWGAALAVLPLLLDPLQLSLEQYVLSDVLFEVLIVTACLVLLWRHRPTTSGVVVVGLLVGYAGLVRGAGVFLLVVFVVAVMCLRVSWVKVVALLVAGLIPLGAYATAYWVDHGHFALVSSGPRFLYARLAPFVACDRSELPSYERLLCPGPPVGSRGGNSWFMWYQFGPTYRVQAPPGMTRDEVIEDFDKRMIRSQPGSYARVVLEDSAAGFRMDRTYGVRDHPASYWLFEDHNWSLDPFPKVVARHRDDPGHNYHLDSDPGAAAFMTAYRHVVFTPGPLQALFLAMAVAVGFGVGRSRLSGVRVAVALLATAYVLPVVTASAFAGFSWRYQLVQIPLLPVAGALAVAALARGPAAGVLLARPPPPMLDRWAAGIAAFPTPARVSQRIRSMADRGRVQQLLALCAGVAAACLCVVMAVQSGWLTWRTGLTVGVVGGACVTAMLLVARARWRRDQRRRRPSEH